MQGLVVRFMYALFALVLLLYCLGFIGTIVRHFTYSEVLWKRLYRLEFGTVLMTLNMRNDHEPLTIGNTHLGQTSM